MTPQYILFTRAPRNRRFSFFAAGACLCLAILAALPGTAFAARLEAPPPPQSRWSTDMLKHMAERRVRTGVGMDAIPAIYRPQFLSVSDASLSMEHDEPVFIVTYPTGLTRIYPQRIMVWHEVVNDVLPDPSGNAIRADTPLSALDAFIITYSPLTGCVTAYYSMAGRFPSTFGVTGELLNANSLLYDRMTGSVWVQLPGVSIHGPLMGRRLSPIQVTWASWKGARVKFPKAQVMSRATGHRRNYGRDPYGSYQRPGNYYDDLRLQYPVEYLDNRLPPKKRILGIELEGITGAVQIDAVKNAGMINMSLGIMPLLAVYDPVLEAVRVFDRRLPGQEEPLSFSLLEGKIVDNATKGEWSVDGVCTYGRFREQRLAEVLTVNAMWFAWAAFYPQTVILPETSFVRPGF